jgi:Tol biopolymer transport system component
LAENLVSGDTNNQSDVFLFDRVDRSLARISSGPGGIQGDEKSADAAISANGLFVAFDSKASNLIASDHNDCDDVFVYDCHEGTVARESVNTAGAEGDSASSYPAISESGRFVAFLSGATNLADSDTNGAYDIFVRDRTLSTTERVSVAAGGAQGNLACEFQPPAISADGRYVAFASWASNLVGSDGNGTVDIFVRDRQLGTTELVSVSTGGDQGNGPSGYPAISAGGRFVAFQSDSSNLVAGDSNSATDIFLRDRQTGTTTLVSVSSAGAAGNAASEKPSLDAAGRYVAFASQAGNLVDGDSNGVADIFFHDCQNGSTTILSRDKDGAVGDHLSQNVRLQPDGSAAVFSSDAGNLVAGDTNKHVDVFVAPAP